MAERTSVRGREPDPHRSPQELLGLMSLEEKAALLTGDSAWTTMPIERWESALSGWLMGRMVSVARSVRIPWRSVLVQRLVFRPLPVPPPPGIPNLCERWARPSLSEAIALEVDIVLGPGVNMKRSPLCGRNFEYFSEDPHLSGRLAVAWINGIQSRGVGASLKHFAVNNQETRRMSVSAEVDERTLREIYLPAFQMAVAAADPWTVMCSYNRVNGTYASEHAELLTDILRE